MGWGPPSPFLLSSHKYDYFMWIYIYGWGKEIKICNLKRGKKVKVIIGVVDRINSWLFNLIAVFFGLIAMLTIYQVFARYILGKPLVWSEEIVRYSMVWIVLLGTVIALRKGLLISVEIVLHVVPSKVRKIMEIFVVSLNIVFLIILVKYGFAILETTSGQNIGALDLPVGVTYFAIPVAGIIGLVNAVVVLIEIFTNKTNEEEKQDGSALI